MYIYTWREETHIYTLECKRNAGEKRARNASGMESSRDLVNLGKGGERGDVELQHDTTGDGSDQVDHLRHAEGLVGQRKKNQPKTISRGFDDDDDGDNEDDEDDSGDDGEGGWYLAHDGVLTLGKHDSAAGVEFATEPLLSRLVALAPRRDVVNARCRFYTHAHTAHAHMQHAQ